jgi:2-oxoglutarate ferredoxin oxidoreductase subunit alpha
MSKTNPVELDKVVIRFAGDSGDGMQLTGSQFTYTSAMLGNDLATFPDFPAEIRAPQGTVEGVSGFQVQIGKVDIYTPGDRADVLVAMNPAALRSNLEWVRKGGNVIIDTDSFEERNIKKAGYQTSPLEDGSLDDFKIIEAHVTSLTRKALEDIDLDNKSIVRCKNMFALGMMYWMFDRSKNETNKFLESKFRKYPVLIEANKKALEAGYNYAITIRVIASNYKIPAAKIEKGVYRHISGNQATAWGLLAAAEKVGRKLFYGSYPITPASDILHELSKHKNLGVITLQAEDEIAAVCSAIGASYAGQIGVTASAGPGIALKGEAIGLAIMAEIPLIVIDVQRGGPSTGLPTKTEQADLNLALYGRNSDCPCIVIAPSTPANCFQYIFESVRLTVEHMTPVMFLSDGYLANGSEPWKLPNMSDLPGINIPQFKENGQPYKPYLRDPGKKSRYWVVPGMAGLEHRIGGLEKEDVTGNVSYDPVNHQKMIDIRADKVKTVADFIPEQEVIGAKSGPLLLVGWGSTFGSMLSAVKEFEKEGTAVGLAHINYLNPLPKNLGKILGSYEQILVGELNSGQLAGYLRQVFPEYKYLQMNKVQGLPFTITEIKEKIISILNQ